MAKPKPFLKVGLGKSAALAPSPPGRPVSNVGKYLLKPTAEMDSGFEMINADVDVLTRVHKQYLKAGQLPPALQPKYLRKPEVMERGVGGRATKISKGWRDPRGRKGR
jgi:hypothetical protein